MNAFENAVKSIAMVLLIIGTGGVLKQTIIDTGIGDTIGMLMSYGNISPYIMAWLITVLIRLATGQLVGVDPALLEPVNSVIGLIIVLIISLIAYVDTALALHARAVLNPASTILNNQIYRLHRAMHPNHLDKLNICRRTGSTDNVNARWHTLTGLRLLMQFLCQLGNARQDSAFAQHENRGLRQQAN